MTQEDSSTENKLGFVNIIIIFLSLYVLIALMVSTLFHLGPEESKLLDFIDDIICVFFLLEFVYRFAKAQRKWHFMKWGWIDLVSSIPSFGYLRGGRALRLIRLLRILRAFRSTKHLMQHIFKNRVQGTFTSLAVIAILMLIFSSIAILQFEDAPNSNIKTAEDALWWSYTTITTVGYGDKYPVTTEDRFVAALLMTVGVGLFGTFTGLLASWFVKDKKTAE